MSQSSVHMSLGVANNLYGDFALRIAVDPAVKSVHPVGSMRRLSKTIGDIDVLILTDEDKSIRPDWMIESLYHVGFKDILANGSVVTRALTDGGIMIDITVISSKYKYPALVHYTGPVDLNIFLRGRAKKIGYSLSQYGLKYLHDESYKEIESEEHLFRILDVPYIAPESRNNWRDIVFGS